MSSRQEEIQAKRARLAELRRQRDLRTQNPAKWRESFDAPDRNALSADAEGKRAAVDELVSDLLGSNASRDADEASRTSRRNLGSSPLRRASPGEPSDSVLLKAQSASTQTLSVAPARTVFEVAPDPLPRREYITYSKGVQTELPRDDPLEEEDSTGQQPQNPVAEHERREDERKHEEIRTKLRGEIEEELREMECPSKRTHSDAKQRYPLRTLTSDELNAMTSSDDFLSFVERSSKVIERALDNDYDLLADYTVSNAYGDEFSDDENALFSHSSKKSYALRQGQQFFDANQSRGRQISDLQFSQHFPELLLSSHTKNPAAANDPSGLIMLWNVHAPSRPEYTFHSPGTDILSARFSPFHPNLILGGCYGGQVCLWDTRASTQPGGAAVLKSPQSGSHAGHNHPVYCISIVGTPNAHNIITASTDGVVCSWSVDMLAQPQEYLELTTPPPSKTDDLAPTCMAFPASDPSFFLVGTEEGNIYPCHRYDRAGAKAGLDPNLVYKGHTAPVMSTQFHPSRGPVDLGDLLLTSSMDWSVKLWRVKAAAVAAPNGPTSTAAGVRGSPQPIEAVLNIGRDDLVYDAKWAPHKPSVFACVTGAGDVEIFDLNMDLEVPVAKASPSQNNGGSLVQGLNKCAWEEKRGGLLAAGGLDGAVSLFEVGKSSSGEARPDEWTKVKKIIARAEAGKR